jgi:hypothetical protein
MGYDAAIGSRRTEEALKANREPGRTDRRAIADFVVGRREKDAVNGTGVFDKGERQGLALREQVLCAHPARAIRVRVAGHTGNGNRFEPQTGKDLVGVLRGERGDKGHVRPERGSRAGGVERRAAGRPTTFRCAVLDYVASDDDIQLPPPKAG